MADKVKRQSPSFAAEASTEQETKSPKGAALRKESTKASGYGAVDPEQEEMMQASGVVGRYDTEALSTYKVLLTYHGSVLQRWDLWKETIVLAVFFWVGFAVIFFFRPPGFRKIIGSESGIRAFLAMFSTLICLLLSFYTALTLGRWWNMRMAIESIQDGCKELTLLICHGVSDDPVLLDALQRYARTSLFLIFAVSQHEDGDPPPLDKAVAKQLLTADEADKLRECCEHATFVQAETLWVWLGNAVTRLNDQGLVKGPPHYCALMKAVDAGRGGITTIKSYLDTPIPLGYVHLLCYIVKLYNLILTFMSVLLAVMYSGGSSHFQPVSVFRIAFKAFFMPFLYNAILVLNSDCTDPFGGDPGDFNWNIYDVNITLSVKSYNMAAQKLPDWITQTRFEGEVKSSKA